MYVYTHTHTHARARAGGARGGLRPPLPQPPRRQARWTSLYNLQHISIVIEFFAMHPLPAGWLREGGAESPPYTPAGVCVYVCVHIHL